MGLKGRVMELLRVGDEQTLGALATRDPGVSRLLLGRLWDPDQALRHRAARALGVASGAHPEMGVELLRRLMWALNDESATNGLHGIPAIAEIGFNNPELVAPFVEPLASLSWDDGLRSEIIRALTRIAETAPEEIRPVCNTLAENVDFEDPDERQAFEGLLGMFGGIDDS